MTTSATSLSMALCQDQHFFFIFLILTLQNPFLEAFHCGCDNQLEAAPRDLWAMAGGFGDSWAKVLISFVLTAIMVALLVPHPFLELLLFGPQLLKFLWLKNFASVVSLDVIPSLEASHRRPRPLWLLLWLAKLALEV
ncbi:hypothetical protein SETIT_1G116300v2 [Setaria italica]|uniref:Uncharacterized protein n=1 Tax=Setaria italica TaxID=4555 RepID=A0A368PJ98_SETIT|nr:hypothetical protein SETIT_1G116300v2 [Setaria italica]